MSVKQEQKRARGNCGFMSGSKLLVLCRRRDNVVSKRSTIIYCVCILSTAKHCSQASCAAVERFLSRPLHNPIPTSPDPFCSNAFCPPRRRQQVEGTHPGIAHPRVGVMQVPPPYVPALGFARKPFSPQRNSVHSPEFPVDCEDAQALG